MIYNSNELTVQQPGSVYLLCTIKQWEYYNKHNIFYDEFNSSTKKGIKKALREFPELQFK